MNFAPVNLVEESVSRLDPMIVDFDKAEQRRTLEQLLRSLRGVHRVEVVRYRKRRSDAQNRYYFGVVVRYLQDFLREQNEHRTTDEVHTIFKAKFLKREQVNQSTGEVIGEYLMETKKLTTAEFTRYIEDCRAWLSDMFHIQTPDPSDY